MVNTNFLKKAVGGESVVNKIVDNITNAIINGELNPGDKLPTEGELSQAMGVGRNSVREAIKILEAYGVVHIKRPEGTFVNEKYDSKMLYPVLYGIILQKGSVKQIIELRRVVDVGILWLVVERLKSGCCEDDSIIKIKEILNNMEKEIHLENAQIHKIYELDVEFHMTIAAITENEMLQSICNYVDKVTRHSRVVTLDQIFLDNKQESFLEKHYRIVKLLEECDSESIYEVVEEHYQHWIKMYE